MRAPTTASDRIGFQLMMDALAAVAWHVLSGTGTGGHGHSTQREALTELGLLTSPGRDCAPTPRGWRLLAAWWEEREGEDPAPGPLCNTGSLAESASFMATGRYRVTTGHGALERLSRYTAAEGSRSVLSLTF
jgi:hypothetical protein